MKLYEIKTYWVTLFIIILLGQPHHADSGWLSDEINRHKKIIEKSHTAPVEIITGDKTPEEVLQEQGQLVEEDLKAKQEHLSITGEAVGDNLRIINENVFEPTWEQIDHDLDETWDGLEAIAKSLAHNFCELAEGQDDEDGKNDYPAEKGDGKNQGYMRCMDEGIYVGVQITEDGTMTPCVEIPIDGKRKGGCYDAEYGKGKNENEKHKDKADQISQQIAIWKGLLGLGDNAKFQFSETNRLPSLNLPPVLMNIFSGKSLEDKNGKPLDVTVMKSSNYIERLAPPENWNPESLKEMDMPNMLRNHILLSNVEMNSSTLRGELEDINVDLLSTGLYVLGALKTGVDIIEQGLELVSAGSTTIGKSTTKYLIKEGLSYADAIIGSNSNEERAVYILSQTTGPIGSIVTNKIDILKDVHFLAVEVPQLKRDTKASKKRSLAIVNKNEKNARKQRIRWEGLIEKKCEIEGIDNPLYLNRITPNTYVYPDAGKTKVEPNPN